MTYCHVSAQIAEHAHNVEPEIDEEELAILEVVENKKLIADSIVFEQIDTVLGRECSFDMVNAALEDDGFDIDELDSQGVLVEKMQEKAIELIDGILEEFNV